MAETKKKRRHLWRYLLGGLGLVVLGAIIFYQPILFSLTSIVAQRVAGAAKISIAYRAHGSIFSDLTLEDVDVHPLPENADLPIETLRAKTVALGYDLPAALRKDWRHVVKVVRLEDATVVIRPTAPEPKKPSKGGPLKFPAVIPERIDLDRVNVTVRQTAGDLNLRNFFLHLRQNADGDLGWQALEIPGVGHWDNVRAGLSERDNVLTITDLALPPLVDVHRLTLDLRGSADGRFGVDLDGAAFETPLTLRAALHPGDAGTPSEASLHLGQLDLARVGALLKQPISGTLPGTDLTWRGDPGRPTTWDGSLRTGAQGVKVGTVPVESADVDVSLQQGTGQINAVRVRSGRNAVQATGDFRLGPDLAHLADGSAAHLGFAAMVPQPELYAADVRGSALVNGSAALEAGAWDAVVRADAAHLTAKGATVPATALNVFAIGVIPFGPNPWTSFQAIAQARVRGAAFDPVQVSAVDATVTLPGTGEAVVTAGVRARDSHADLQARAPLPNKNAPFDVGAVTADLDLTVPALADFLSRKLYDGTLGLQGRIHLVRGQPDGALQVTGDDLAYQGAAVQAIRAQVRFANGEALVGPAQVVVDPDNRVDLTGKAGLNSPYPYEVNGQVNLPKLANFNALLKAFGQPDGITGNLRATVSGRGDLNHVGGHVEANGDGLGYRGLQVQGLQALVNLDDNQVDVPNLQLLFDERNGVKLTGHGDLSGPRPFSLQGKINLADLSSFNPALKGFGQPEGLDGSLNVDLNGRGTLQDPSSAQAALNVKGDAVHYRGLAIQSLQATASLADRRAQAPSIQMVFDAHNRVDLSADALLTDPKPFHVSGRVDLGDLGFLNPALKGFGQPEGLAGSVNVDLKGEGNLDDPLGSQADVTAAGEALRYRGVTVQTLQATAALADKHARVQAFRLVFDPRNTVDLSGEADLTGPEAFAFTGKIDLQDLGLFNPALRGFGQPEGLSGTLRIDASGHGQGTDLLGAQATADVAGNAIRYRGVTVQTLQATAALADKHARVQTLRLFFDPKNTIDLSGEADLAAPQAFSFTGDINLQDLGLFNPALAGFGQPEGLSGSLALNASGYGKAADPLGATANFSVGGKTVRYRGLTIAGIDLQGTLADRRASVPVGRITFDPKNTIDFGGDVQTQEPYAYHGSANVAWADLGFLNDLLKSFGQDVGLGGKLNAHWNGDGPLRESIGNFSLRGESLRGKGVENVGVDVGGTYRGPDVNVPTLRVRSPYANADAAVKFSPQLLEIPSLSVTRAGNALTGRARVPLDLRPGVKVPIARDAPLDVLLQADKVSLASLQNGKPAVTGEAGFKLAVSQTLQDPLVEVGAAVRDVRSPAVSALSAFAGNFSVRLADKVLTLDGHVTQADIQPIAVNGRIPLDVGQVLDTGKLPDDTPLQFSLKWPSTNLAFVQRVVPLFRRLEGRVGADVTVGGTVKKPVVAGLVDANIPRLQANKDIVPPLSNFVARIALQGDKVRFDQLSGLAGGGPFRVSGGVDLADGTNPKFDIAVKGDQVLLTRTDNVIARANFDLAIRGPLSAGEVSGSVGVINSRFFQDIDILPLNLPGRPAPKPPSVPPPSQVSITAPPLRDWKFNIAIRTATPFLVQSNLARGRVTVDLKVSGTGLQPAVTGFVRVDQLTASLPFSHLDITDGYVNFAPGGNPLDPSLNIIGTSTIRDYDVRMRIFGNVSNFQILFDSTPPLAQGDIATLLATGATTSEFVENPSLLAGRATFILAQQLLTKVFKLKPNENQQAFLERLQVDIVPGSRPGTQDVSARFSLTKNYQLIGEFGQEGNVSARLRYLIRFR